MPILSLTHKFEILCTTFLGNCEAVWYNGNRLPHPFWSISRFQTPWCSLPAVQPWPSVTSVRQQPTRISGILRSWNNSRSFNKWTAYEGVMGLRKPQREDSHLRPVKASLVLRDGRTRSWRGRESHGKRAALVARGLPLVKRHRRPGWPRSPIQALQHLSPTREQEPGGAGCV